MTKMWTNNGARLCAARNTVKVVTGRRRRRCGMTTATRVMEAPPPPRPTAPEKTDSVVSQNQPTR